MIKTSRILIALACFWTLAAVADTAIHNVVGHTPTADGRIVATGDESVLAGIAESDRLGSLDAGKRADFIVVDRDYCSVPASEIDDIDVLQTWVGGQLVYDAAGED